MKVIRHASNNSVGVTGFTNPGNAYASDDSYATAAPGTNSTISSYFGGFDLASYVPSGSFIHSVTFSIERKMSTTASSASTTALAYDDATAIGTIQTSTAEPTSDTIWVYTPSTLPTITQVRSNNFKVLVGAKRGSGSTGYTFSLDDVFVTVDYTPPPAAPVVQVKRGIVNASGSTTLSFDTLPTVGNLIVAVPASYGGNLATTSVSDNQGHTYTQRGKIEADSGTDNGDLCQYHTTVTTSSGTFTVTINPDGSSADVTWLIMEISGRASSPYDTAVTAQAATTSTSASTGNITPSENNCLLVAAVSHTSTDTPITETLSGCALIDEIEGGSSFIPLSVIVKLQTTAATEAATWTLGASVEWICNVVSYKAAATSVALAIQDASHAQTVENIGLVQHQILAVDNASQAQTAGNLSLVQHQILAVDNTNHLQTVENITVVAHAPSTVLVIQGAEHLQTVEQVGLTQHQILVIQNAEQLQTAGNVGLVQHQILTVANASQAQTVENVVVVYHAPGGVALVIASCEHLQTAGSLSLTQHQILAVDNTNHLQTVANVGLVQHQILAVDNSNHLQTVENIVFVMGYTLTIQNATHAQSVENVGLVQHQILTVANASQAQTVENVVVVYHAPGGVALVIASCEHLQTAGSLSLTQHQILTVANASQAQTVENVVVVYHAPGGVVLTIQNADHAQTAGSLSLTQHQILAVDNTNHLQTVANVGLVQHQILTVANASQAQTVENIGLVQHQILLVDSCYHAQTVGSITFLYAIIYLTSRTRSFVVTSDKRETAVGSPARDLGLSSDKRDVGFTSKTRDFDLSSEE